MHCYVLYFKEILPNKARFYAIVPLRLLYKGQATGKKYPGDFHNACLTIHMNLNLASLDGMLLISFL